MYICRIELDDLLPKVWREFQFHPDVTFHQLHQIIQVVMGWKNRHRYEFIVNERGIGNFEESGVLDARQEIVKQHVNEEHPAFTYVYDFGDDWEHTVTLVQMNPAISDPAPYCLDGERRCPPEDVGGVFEYRYCLDVLSTPNPQRSQLLNWVEADYDPEYFSCEEVNSELQRKKIRLVPRSNLQKSEVRKPVKLTKSVLNQYLKQLSHDQLIDLVKACYGASKDVEKFLAVRILGDEAMASLFEEYRKKIEQVFFPKRGIGKLRLQDAKKLISEFEKLTGSVEYIIELKLVHLENAIEFMNGYGYYDEAIYKSIVLQFADVIEMLVKDETGELFSDYEERIERIVWNSGEIGGFLEDELAELQAQIL